LDDKMPRSASASVVRSEFDPFLFASIGDERNGMSLSVLSALARLDVDPWLEAASLAQAPKDVAIDRMTLLISKLPEKSVALLDPRAIADGLIALLPRLSPSTAPRTVQLRVTAPTYPRMALFLMIMAILLGTQFLMRIRQPSPQEQSARVQASSMDSKQTPSAQQ
jgi:hypothetical protein